MRVEWHGQAAFSLRAPEDIDSVLVTYEPAEGRPLAVVPAMPWS
jgi:hypothetical protein